MSFAHWRQPLFWVVLGVEALLVAALARWSDLAEPGNAARFVTIALGAGAAYLAAVVLFGNARAAWRPQIFWGMAVALRLVALPMTPGDDISRYIWEGRLQHEMPGYNPYVQAPSDVVGEDWRQVNHPGHAAIYPPGAELFFSAATRVSTSPMWMKSLFALADLLVVYLLLRINTGSGRYRASAWYAWNPVVLIAFAGGGHYDSLMMAALVAAVWALRRANPLDQQSPAWSWALLSALFLGLAISLKVVPVFLIPVWLLALWEGDRHGRPKTWASRLSLPALTALISLGVPFLLSLPYGGPRVVLGPLNAFSDVARFGDILWWAVELLWKNPTGDNSRYRIAITLAVLVVAWVMRRDWRRSALWVLGAMLILSPVLHLWYIAWILPLAAWRRSYPWFIFSLTSLVSLLVWNEGPGWEAADLTLPMRAFIILPPIIALIFLDWRRAVTPPDERLHPRP